MLLQANEDYLMRNKGRVTIYEVYPQANIAHGAIWSAHYGHSKDEIPLFVESWRTTGKHLSNPDLDLLKAWRDKHPAEDLEDGTIVEASHTGVDWILHRFAFFDKDTQQCFVFPTDGRGNPLPVPFCRPPRPWKEAEPVKCPDCGSTDIATATWLARDGSAWSQDECFSCRKVFSVRPPRPKKI